MEILRWGGGVVCACVSEERIAACHLSFSRPISYSDRPIVCTNDSSNLISAVDVLALAQTEQVRKSLRQLLPAVFLWMAPKSKLLSTIGQMGGDRTSYIMI